MLKKIKETKNVTEQNMGNYSFKGELYETKNGISFTPCGIKNFSVINDALLPLEIKDECNRTLLSEVSEIDACWYQINKIINIESLPGEK